MSSPAADHVTAGSLEPTVLRALARYRLLAVVIVFASVLAAIALSMRSGDTFAATMDVIVRDPRTTQVFESGEVGSPERYVADQAAVLRSTNVAVRVVELAAELDPPIVLTLDEVTESSRVDTNADNSQVSVTYTSDLPSESIAVANLFLVAYEDVRETAGTRETKSALDQLDSTIAGIDEDLLALNTQIQEQIQAEVGGTDLDAAARAALEGISRATQAGDTTALANAVGRFETIVDLNVALRQRPQAALLIAAQQQLVDRRATLVSRRDEIEVDAQLATSGVVLASPAVEATESPADVVRLVIAGIVLGSMLAAAVCYLLAIRRVEFTDRRQPEAVLRVPLVADVPEYADPGESLPMVVAPTSVEAEAFRFAAGSLRVLARDENAAVVAVVSSSIGEGKTSLTANMAIALAEDGVRVALVDADLTRQGLTSMLLHSDTPVPGLREVLDGSPLAGALKRIQPWPMAPTLDLLPAGGSGVADRAILPAPLAEVFRQLKEDYDIVLVDTPPLLQVAATSMIVSLADSVLAVVAHGSAVSRARDLVERVSMSNAPLLGYVYNKNRNRAAMPTYYVVPDGAESKRQAWTRR